MPHIDVLITSELAGGADPFRHGDLQIAFHYWRGIGEVPLFEGRLWAFLDWEVPDISGIELCRRIRCEPLMAHAHITMIVGDDRQSKALAIRHGADDFVVGPVNRRKLLDRLLSFHQDAAASALHRRLELADLTVDLTAFQARWKDRPLTLRPNEFRLLRYFVEHPGRVFTRAQLIAALGKQDPQIDERTVDVWIGRLRRALRSVGAGDRLRTVRMMGYVFDKP